MESTKFGGVEMGGRKKYKKYQWEDRFWEYKKIPMESTIKVRLGFGSMKKVQTQSTKKVRTEISQNPKYAKSIKNSTKKVWRKSEVQKKYEKSTKYDQSTKKVQKKYEKSTTKVRN